MGKPAARVGDKQKCPMADPVTKLPHKGGVITGPGCGSVLIGGKPAAVAGDDCTCTGAPGTFNKITGGSTGVFIGGKPAVRKGDECAHGGVVTGGLGSVLIGERGNGAKEKERKESSVEEKLIIINETLKRCVLMLENKLKMMLEYDPQIFKDFGKWFGLVTKRKRDIILKRVRKMLEACKDLGVNDFELVIESEDEKLFGYVYNIIGSRPKIYLGVRFWKIKNNDERSRVGVIIHELSHLKDIGKTNDTTYGMKDSLILARNYPDEALFNADSFEFFITG